MRRGWFTSELTVTSVFGVVVVLVAQGGDGSLPDALSRAAASLAIGTMAAAYSLSRGRAKGGQ